MNYLFETFVGIAVTIFLYMLGQYLLPDAPAQAQDKQIQTCKASTFMKVQTRTKYTHGEKLFFQSEDT